MAITDLPIFAASRIVPSQVESAFNWRDLLITASQLPFNMQAQTQTQWCWAATATSTSIFYRSWSTWTQCSVASTTLGRTDCCNTPVPVACNVPWYLDQAFTTTNNYVSMTGPVSYSAIQAEISAGRVLGARIGWSGGGGHFMVIYGCSTVNGVQYLNIDDPIYGKSNPSLATFSSNYQGSGSWTHTYYTRAAPLVLKFPPFEISPKLLDLIRQVRPLLVPPGKRAALDAESLEEEMSFALAHPVHVVGLDQFVGKGPVVDRPSAIRLLEMKGNQVDAFYDLSPDSESPSLLQFAGADNDYVHLLERGLSVAGTFADGLASGQAEGGAKNKPAATPTDWSIRMLRIPALYTEAIILSPDRGDEVAIVIRSPDPDVALFKPMLFADLRSQLEPTARVILADDDGLKGS